MSIFRKETVNNYSYALQMYLSLSECAAYKNTLIPVLCRDYKYPAKSNIERNKKFGRVVFS